MFPMEIDTLEYSRVKDTTIFVHLRIFLFMFKIPNKLYGVVAGELGFCLSLVIALRSFNNWQTKTKAL